jgi:hypothetical protein
MAGANVGVRRVLLLLMLPPHGWGASSNIILLAKSYLCQTRGGGCRAVFGLVWSVVAIASGCWRRWLFTPTFAPSALPSTGCSTPAGAGSVHLHLHLHLHLHQQ